MDNNKLHSTSTTELNIFDLIQLIVANKLKIILSLVFFVICGVIYINNFPPPFKVSIKINQVNYEEISNYAFLNSINTSINTSERSEQKLEMSDTLISSEKLMEIFINELSSLDGIIASLEANKKNIDIDYKDINEKKDILRKIAKGFVIEEQLNFKKTKLNYLVSFNSNDITEAKLILRDALDYTNNKVKVSVSNELFNIKNSLANDAVYESKRVALDTLIYLKNQLLIAEKFEISDPSIERQIINLLKDNVQWETNKVPHYLLGTKILKRHIEDLEYVVNDQNKDENDILNVLSSVGIFSLKPLHQLTQVARLEEAISISPIIGENFKAVNYDIDLIDVSKSSINTLFMILFVIMGLLFGIFIAIYTSKIKKK